MAKWQVKIKIPAEVELRSLLTKGIVSKSDVKVLLQWVDEMEEFGPKYIAASSQWHDHALEREWAGFRSSAFSSAGRVIYKIEDFKITVEVHKVLTNHNYKK